MTEKLTDEALDHAISLICSEDHWTAEDWSCPYEPSDGHRAVAAILNAIIAGQLVRATPADDLRAAVLDESKLHELWLAGNCRMSFDSFKADIRAALAQKGDA